MLTIFIKKALEQFQVLLLHSKIIPIRLKLLKSSTLSFPTENTRMFQQTKNICALVFLWQLLFHQFQMNQELQQRHTNIQGSSRPQANQVHQYILHVLYIGDIIQDESLNLALIENESSKTLLLCLLPSKHSLRTHFPYPFWCWSTMWISLAQ